MQIGFDARLVAYREGGIARYVRSLLTALVASDRANGYTIFVARSGEPIVDSTDRGDQIIHRALLTPPHHRWERAALSVELMPHHFDLFHSPDFIQPRLSRGTRSVITVHDLAFLRDPDLLDGPSRRYYGQIYEAVKRADAIIAPSENTRRDLVDLAGAPEERIAIIPEAADTRYRRLDRAERMAALRAPERNHLTSDMVRIVSGEFGPFILFVGTIEPRKNLAMFFRAYERYRERAGQRAVMLVLAGAEGWRAEREGETISRLAHEGKAVWFQGATDEQLLLLYNAASLLVLPSRYEGFGLTALEAMACGTPVIASDCASLPEVVGTAGILLAADDEEGWANALREVAEDRPKREVMIAGGLQQAAAFSWARAAEQTLAVYRRVLGQDELAPANEAAVSVERNA